MLRWTLAVACTVMLMGSSQDKPLPARMPTDTQPATRPAETSALRKPVQAEILKNLLGREQRVTPIRPQEPQTRPGAPGARPPGTDAEARPLLLEGTFLVERPGRLVHEGGRAKFVFHAEADTHPAQTMEILPNQLLEAMEHEAETGFTEFIISAEVTRYRGTNYLIVRKILRRVGHGNLRP